MKPLQTIVTVQRFWLSQPLQTLNHWMWDKKGGGVAAISKYQCKQLTCGDFDSFEYLCIVLKVIPKIMSCYYSSTDLQGSLQVLSTTSLRVREALHCFGGDGVALTEVILSGTYLVIALMSPPCGSQGASQFIALKHLCRVSSVSCDHLCQRSPQMDWVVASAS